jgi:hypothetical protein
VSQHLITSLDSDPNKADWSYTAIVGKLHYLEACTRPDLSYSVYKAARFSANPRITHAEAVARICRYLNGTQDKGLIFHPDPTKGFEVWADADWAGHWHKDTAQDDPGSAKSRSGILLTWTGCPVLWLSRLMPLICLSTTEAEYCTQSDSLRHVIPMIQALDETIQRGIITQSFVPEGKCKAFEDNSGALELATVPKMRPRTKHINIRYHHFSLYTDGPNPKIFIHAVPTEERLAGVFTKAVNLDLFRKFRKAIMGW